MKRKRTLSDDESNRIRCNENRSKSNRWRNNTNKCPSKNFTARCCDIYRPTKYYRSSTVDTKV